MSRVLFLYSASRAPYTLKRIQLKTRMETKQRFYGIPGEFQLIASINLLCVCTESYYYVEMKTEGNVNSVLIEFGSIRNKWIPFFKGRM